MKLSLRLMAAAVVLAPATAYAQEPTEASPPAPAPAVETAAPGDDAAAPIGLTLDVGLASAYLFRGLNVFAEKELTEQKAYVAPSITWTGLDGRLVLGYWGAWQAVGDNIGDKIDAGLGAETDLFATWNQKVSDSLTVSPGLVTYVYAMADEKVAGTSTPLVLEPGVAATLASAADLTFKASWFYAVQSEIKAWRYAYFSPGVGNSVALGETTALALSATYGYEAAADFDDNVHDAAVAVAVPVTLGAWYVKPGLGAAWTNIVAKDFADEVAVFGSVNVGVGL